MKIGTKEYAKIHRVCESTTNYGTHWDEITLPKTFENLIPEDEAVFAFGVTWHNRPNILAFHPNVTDEFKKFLLKSYFEDANLDRLRVETLKTFSLEDINNKYIFDVIGE